MNLRHRPLLVIACVSLFFSSSNSLAQDAYPIRPIRVVVPQAPGGTSDMLGRLYADYLSKSIGQPVIVDNKPGANGVLAAGYVVKQPADGYTVFVAGVSNLALNPIMYKSLPYNPERDFEGIGLLANTSFLLLVNPTLGIKSLSDLSRVAKERPGGLNFASAGKGNSTHLIMEMLAQRMNIKLTHVPYNGTAPGLASVIANQTQLMSDVLATGAVQAKTNKVQALAVIGSQRASALPDVPTLSELGVKDFPLPSWFALVTLAGTPRSAIKRLNAETQNFLTDPQVRARLTSLALEPLPSGPDAVKDWMRRDAKVWGPLIEQLGISHD